MDFALQLWSINTKLEKDFYGTLEKVAKMGYTGVEFAGYGQKPAAELKKNLDKYGLIAVGSHISLDKLKNNLQDEIEYSLAIGNKYLVCPWAKLENRADIDELANILNHAANEAKKHGLKIAYHNHNHEFEKIDGQYILDTLIKNTTDVAFEIDIFWVKHAGLDPIEYIKKCGDRAPLIHLKQIDPNKKNVDFSEGIIDMLQIIKASKYAEHFIIEQERLAPTPLASAKNNINWMRDVSASHIANQSDSGTLPSSIG